jgi:hypothetical protein
MPSTLPFDSGLDLGLSRDETAALQRVAGDLGVEQLADFVALLLRDVAQAELDPDGWQNEAVAEWLQHRLSNA